MSFECKGVLNSIIPEQSHVHYLFRPFRDCENYRNERREREKERERETKQSAKLDKQIKKHYECNSSTNQEKPSLTWGIQYSYLFWVNKIGVKYETSRGNFVRLIHKVWGIYDIKWSKMA